MAPRVRFFKLVDGKHLLLSQGVALQSILDIVHRNGMTASQCQLTAEFNGKVQVTFQPRDKPLEIPDDCWIWVDTSVGQT